MLEGNFDPRLPVTLVTGWLGAGKTTLLNRLLSRPEGRRYAVLVNEFGEIGVDHRLIASASEDLIELSNGCVCCTVRGDLVRALARLQKRRWKGWWRRRTTFDRVLLETTGLAEPAPLLRTFLVEAGVATLYRLSSTVTVVDARNLDAAWADLAAREQIALADVLLLNKIDLCAEPALAGDERRLRALNPTALLLRCQRAEVDPEVVLAERPFAAERLAGHEAHEHVAGLGAVCLREERPLDAMKVELWLRACVRTLGARLVRYKGFLQLDDQPRRVVLQGVYELFSADAGPPWEDDAPRTELVFIGYDLDAEFLRRGLLACRAEAPPSAAAR